MSKFSAFMRGEQGTAAGFGTISVSATTVSYTTPINVSVSTDGPNNEKNFNFDFKIPAGVPGGFDTPSATSESIPSNQAPGVTITSSGPDSKKKFNFAFKIPVGATGGYNLIQFSTASSGTGFKWNGNTLCINRENEKYIPIIIYKTTNNKIQSIAATFRIDDTYIYYDADAKFAGQIFVLRIG